MFIRSIRGVDARASLTPFSARAGSLRRHAALLGILALASCTHGNDASNTDGIATVQPAQTTLIDELGMLDGDAQKLVAAGTLGAAPTIVAQMEQSWTTSRSQLQEQGAADGELVTVDGALHELDRAVTESRAYRRAANDVTAALAPLYMRAGDGVPEQLHGLDYLQREMMIDVSEADWVRAKGHIESARATWRSTRKTGRHYRAEPQFVRYARALDGLDDAIEARSGTRFYTAITQADSSLAAVEAKIDRATAAPWRRFFQ